MNTKSGFTRQKQMNYFSARIKIVGGHITSEQLATIKNAAEKFGKGYIHLTNRQGIVIPFIHAENVNALKNFLSAGGVKINVCAMTIVACQGNAVCPSGLIDTQKLAAEFDRRYGECELPRKFKIGIAGCQNNCLKVEQNDIGVKGGVNPIWCAENCTFCGACQAVCPQKIITVDKSSRTVMLDENSCVHCGKCIKNCPVNAWHGESGCMISFGGNFLPRLFDATELYKIVDAAIKFFSDNAEGALQWKNFRHQSSRQ